MQLRISLAEYERRISAIREGLARDGAEAFVAFGAKRIAYLVGYHVVPTERPLALVVPCRGKIFVFVPRLEKEAAESQALIEEVFAYFECPGAHPPLGDLCALLQRKGLARRLWADGDGYSGLWGYEGPKLSDLMPDAEIRVSKVVQEMWRHKTAEEIALIKETAIWGNLAHAKLHQYARVGETEIDISLRASADASREMLQALGPEYGGFFRGGWPTHAWFWAGPNSALPHCLAWNRKLQPGDVLITGATGTLWGYTSELERTMVVGEPSAEQKRLFQIMQQAQARAIETCGPGVPLAEVDGAVWSLFEEQKVTMYAQHHTGHHLGFEAHEPPFIDRASKEIMEPGQVYSIEPGLYVPGRYGFRHSDTIAITEKGVDLLTYYPRDLDRLIVPL